jgi:ligand-binding sensor domain-containing protein
MDKDDIIWAGKENGLVRFNTVTGAVDLFQKKYPMNNP